MLNDVGFILVTPNLFSLRLVAEQLINTQDKMTCFAFYNTSNLLLGFDMLIPRLFASFGSNTVRNTFLIQVFVASNSGQGDGWLLVAILLTFVSRNIRDQSLDP